MLNHLHEQVYCCLYLFCGLEEVGEKELQKVICQCVHTWTYSDQTIFCMLYAFCLVVYIMDKLVLILQHLVSRLKAGGEWDDRG